jgi:hypothetical protein
VLVQSSAFVPSGGFTVHSLPQVIVSLFRLNVCVELERAKFKPVKFT